MSIYVDYDRFVAEIYNPCVQALKEIPLNSDTSFGIRSITTDVEASIIETYCELYKAVYYTVSSMLADYAEARIYIHNFSLVDRYLSNKVDGCTASKTAAVSAFVNLTGHDYDSDAENATLDENIPEVMTPDYDNNSQSIIVNSYMIGNLIRNIKNRLDTLENGIECYENSLNSLRDAQYLSSRCCLRIRRNILENHTLLLNLLKELTEDFRMNSETYLMTYRQDFSKDEFVYNKCNFEYAREKLNGIEEMYSDSVNSYRSIQFEAKSLPAFNPAQAYVFGQVNSTPSRTELIQNLTDIRTKIDSYITTIDEVEETFKGRFDSELADDIETVSALAKGLYENPNRFTMDSGIINGVQVETITGGDVYSILGEDVHTYMETGVATLTEALENYDGVDFSAEEIEEIINRILILDPDVLVELGKPNTDIDISDILEEYVNKFPEAVIPKAIEWAVDVAGNPNIGYVFGAESGLNADGSPKNAYDCSGFVITAFMAAGVPVAYVDDNGGWHGASYTGNMVSAFTANGFVDVVPLPDSVNELIPGDVIKFHYCTDENNYNGHTMLYLGDGSFVHASWDYDGVAGDGNNTEIFQTQSDNSDGEHYWNYGDGYWRNGVPHDCFHVLRYVG